ncbi:MAG TPA: PVC-type heme-binding CxxCH protein [Fimbriiglobus sp.]|jgi:putative membrane-bound dehydrogenase-like protein
MRHWLAIFLLFLPSFASAADTTPAPFPAKKAAETMIVPDGFRTTLVAAEPDVVQPISFTIDARGRLWVAEALNYGAWKPTGKDRIVILEEQPGGGVKRTVFYEGLNYVTGVEVGFGGVWVMSPPSLYFIPDRDGNDKPDGPPEVILDGFGYKESRHNLANGFTWGPDGWLYAGHGRTSPSDVGLPGTPASKRIHCDGGVYRVHPVTHAFEVFADGTTNPWGVDFDDFGQAFVSNCVTPHLFHMIQGGHYEPWRNRPSSLYAYQRLPTIADHLHYPGGDIHATLDTPDNSVLGGGHAHCGTLVYLGDQFPEKYRNTVMMCNVHGRRINNDILKRKGSGYVASHGSDFMQATDPWFMGVTLRTGPDGSVYVSDWSDTGECHTPNPDKSTGRIFKISYGPPGEKKPDLYKMTDEKLVELQLHRNDYFVRHARRILQERANVKGWNGKGVHAALRDQLHSTTLTEPQRLRAMWALQATGGLERAQLLTLLADRHEHVRAWAVQLLCETPPQAAVVARLAELAKSDPSPVVRVFLASALQRLPWDRRWGIADGLASHADGTDPNLPLMLWYGVEPLVPTDTTKVLDLAVRTNIPLVRQFIARRTMDAAASRGEKADLSPLVTALARSTEPAQLDLLRGIREGLRGRKSLPLPAGWTALYPRLHRSSEKEIRGLAAVLALTFGDPEALKELIAEAKDPKMNPADRTAALDALIGKRVPGLAPLLFDELGDKATRRTALRGLATEPHPDTPKKVLAIYPTLADDEKTAAIATLTARKEFAFALLDAVEKKTIPRTDISAFAARQMYSLRDGTLTTRLRSVWGEVRNSNQKSRAQMAKYKALLSPAVLAAADRSQGRLVFSKTCQQCHKLFGEGASIGPDLTGSNRDDLIYLLLNVIDPSAEVARDYRMSTVRLKDDRVLTGIVVERTPARVTVQTATERVVLSPVDVDDIKESALSIMPEGQLDPMTKDQVRDLFGYLQSKSQVPLPAAKK